MRAVDRLPAEPLPRARLLFLLLGLLAAILTVGSWAAGRPTSWTSALGLAVAVNWLGWRWLRWSLTGAAGGRLDDLTGPAAILLAGLAAGPGHAVPLVFALTASRSLSLPPRRALAGAALVAGAHLASIALVAEPGAYGFTAALPCVPMQLALAVALSLVADSLVRQAEAGRREGALRMATAALLATADADRVRVLAEETALELAGRPPGGRARLLEGADALAAEGGAPGFTLLPVPGPGAPCALAVEADVALDADVREALGGLAAVVALARAVLSARDRRAEHLWRALVRGAADLVAVVDAGGAVIAASPSLARALGRAPDALAGARLAELVDPEDAEQVRSLLRALAAGDPAPAEPLAWRLARTDGGWVEVEVIATSLLDDPDVRGVMLAGRDVGERHRMEAELSASRRLLRAALAR